MRLHRIPCAWVKIFMRLDRTLINLRAYTAVQCGTYNIIVYENVPINGYMHDSIISLKHSH